MDMDMAAMRLVGLESKRLEKPRKQESCRQLDSELNIKGSLDLLLAWKASKQVFNHLPFSVPLHSSSAMVIITLDNIIPYHPPPAKLPPKPSQPHPSISSGLRPSAKTTLSLIHPLPQHPLRPSFPACVNSSPSDKVNTYSAPDSGLGEHTIPVYSNAFDMELAKHDWVVTKDATADVDTDGDSSEQWQNDFVNDIQRRQQDGSCNCKWSYRFSDLFYNGYQHQEGK